MLLRRVEGDHAFKEWKRDARSHRAKGMASVDQPRLSPNIAHFVFPSFHVFWIGKSKLLPISVFGSGRREPQHE